MSRLLKSLFIIVIVAMLGAALLQIFIPEFLGKRTGFGLSPGWQREIGYWNIGMIVMLTAALIKKNNEIIIVLAYGTSTIGILFCINHLVGFMNHTSSYMNLFGAIENFLLVSLLIYVLFRDNFFVKEKKNE